MSDNSRREAQESYEAGDFERSRSVSLTGLEIDPNDLELMRIAGKSGVELAEQDAVTMLQRVVAAEPGDGSAWHDLGEALAAEGRIREAADAFKKAADLAPDDPAALIDHGHSAYAAGQVAEAIESLERAAALRGDDLETTRALIDIYRRAGRIEDALAAAERLGAADPDDVYALLELADAALALGRHADAARSYERMREVDDEPEHEVYALHGLLQVAMRQEDWPRAAEVADEAIKLDPSGRTESLLGFFAAQAATPRPDHPGRIEVDQALAASQAEHRRLHSQQFAEL